MPIRFMTLNPGHFHAALVQKEMYAGVAPMVDVYAPLDSDLVAHLARVAGFNSRAQGPTSWQLEVHAGPGALERMLRDRPGNVLVLAGNNGAKIAAIAAAVEAGLHVLADKPWIIRAADLSLLQAVLNRADERGLIAYDIMTERHEITSILQRELINDRNVFGTPASGSEGAPAVIMESVHYLKKNVAGVPLRRPPWFFDVRQQGEGLNDVGTHLVDLVLWMLFPDQPIDYRDDIAIISGKSWPTELTREDFAQVTGEMDFPAFLHEAVSGTRLCYQCNSAIHFAVRGVHVGLNILWNFEAAAGAGDSHFASFQGSRSRIEVRQGIEEKFKPELYVVPQDDVRAALERRVTALGERFPGLALDDQGKRIRVVIPESYRTGHEAHFAEVTRRFLRFLTGEEVLREWERPNMLTKYFVTTHRCQ